MKTGYEAFLFDGYFGGQEPNDPNFWEAKHCTTNCVEADYPYLDEETNTPLCLFIDAI